jgi:hypothetical protein
LLQFPNGIDQLDIQLVSSSGNCCDSSHHRDARCDRIQSSSVIDDYWKNCLLSNSGGIPSWALADSVAAKNLTSRLRRLTIAETYPPFLFSLR